MAFSARVQIRQGFATQHLWTARHMARLCAEREAELLKQGVSSDVQHRSYAVTAVISAVAFLEAHINEAFADAADDNPVVRQQIANVPQNAADLMGKLWDDREVKAGERLSILAKYQLALVCSGKPMMESDRNPYQHARKLISLRNALVHFKIEWQWHDVAYKLEKELKPAGFQENQLHIGAPWYPNKCLGAGCAQWACDTAHSFVSAWRNQMDIVRAHDEDLASWAAP